MLTRSYLPPDQRQSLLTYTPMFHARLFGDRTKFRDEAFQPLRTSLESALEKETVSHLNPTDLFLDGNPSMDRPLFVQFCANDPDYLLAAARYVEPFCDAVDLNLGCPQGIAKKGRYGAFLQEDWDLIYRLINRLHLELSIPVTAKIRILETKELTLAYAKMVISAGASILTVHGRRREQKGQATGLADWDMIRHLRENLPEDVVLFANGNILQHEDLEACQRYTGVDAVMTADAALYDPTVFAPPPAADEAGRDYWIGRDGKGGYRMDAVMRRYFDTIYRYVLETEPPERKPLFIPSDPTVPTSEAGTESDLEDQPPQKKHKRRQDRIRSPNLRPMQSHLFNLLRPMIVKHTHIRTALTSCHVGDMPAFERVLTLVERATKEGLIEYERSTALAISDGDRDKEEAGSSLPTSLDSSAAAIKRCRRPWWICQPYIRPLPQETAAKNKEPALLVEANGNSSKVMELEHQIDQNPGLASDGGSNDLHVESRKETLVCS